MNPKRVVHVPNQVLEGLCNGSSALSPDFCYFSTTSNNLDAVFACQPLSRTFPGATGKADPDGEREPCGSSLQVARVP